MARAKKVSPHPMSFEEAVQALAQPKHEDSEVEESGSTTEADPAPAPSKRRTSRRRKSSDD